MNQNTATNASHTSSDNNDNFEFIRGILGSIAFGTLATATLDAKPWNSPVIMVHDDDLNFYWFSDRQSQHGRNVSTNPHVFIVIYDSTVAPFISHIDRGLYLEAEAHEVSDLATVNQALALKQAMGGGHNSPDGFSGEAVRRVYQAVPTRAWINDIEKKDGKFVRDIRTELPLDGLKKYLLGSRRVE